MTDIEASERFESLVLPHLDAAYNFARWLTRDDHRARDVAQESLCGPCASSTAFRGENARPWLLSIVRNTYFSSLKATQREELRPDLDDDIMGSGARGGV